jgi:divalent metal cation (Fe/Co/Zn/Cd) transporter
MTTEIGEATRASLLRRGRHLEVATLAWNVVSVVVLVITAISSRSVALAGFGIDSILEIGASTVVLWELADSAVDRQRRALHLIGFAFMAVAAYLAIQSTLVLVVGFRPHHSPLGMTWTALSALVMFALAKGKKRTGTQLANQVLVIEGRVTMIDAFLATAVLTGLALNAFAGWWWADPASGYVLVLYAFREARASLVR